MPFKKTKTTKQRFNNLWLLAEATGCWLWQASTDRGGYGIFGLDKKSRIAHRVSYEIHVGPIPDGLCVCHRCDVRSCVNPDHLFLGTLKDNSQDMVSKGRGTRGERSGMCKWTDQQIEEIRNLIASGLSQRKVAKLTGIPRGTICGIHQGIRRAYS